MKLFIVGPLIQNGLIPFLEARDKLQGVGFEVILPEPWCIIGDMDDPINFMLWSPDAHLNVYDCDALVLLPGWYKSPGTMFEVGLAHASNKPYALLEFWLEGRIPHKHSEIGWCWKLETEE